MANTTVFTRTQKGNAELMSASGALGPQLRNLLNRIDGKSTVDQIQEKLGRVDTAKLAEAFFLLVQEGYIVPAAAPAKPAPAAPAPAKPAPAKPAPAAPAPVKPAPAKPAPATPAPVKPAPAKPAPATPAPVKPAPAKPALATPAPTKPAPMQPAPPSGEPITLDFTRQLVDAPVPPPSAEQKQEAEVLTVAGMRTLKSAGYYVNILSKPGLLRPPRSGGKKHMVLILEDDKASALVVARTLMVAGFDVRSAETRDAALAELKKVPLPDAIVLNPKLKDINGLDLLSRLQQHQFYCSVPVVIVTADLNHEDVVDALARGASGYMTKPFKPEALLDTVRAVLGLK